MKVLIVGPFSPPVTGCSYANEVLLKRLVADAHVCSFIDSSASAVASIQGSAFSFLKALRFVHLYLKLARVAECDVLYITPGQTLYGLLKYAPFTVFARLLGKPYVIHVHGNHLGTHFRRLGRFPALVFQWLVSHAAAGIVLSSSLKQNFRELLPDERVFVVENFAGDEMFGLGSESERSVGLRILYLSNLMREKGILDVLDALALLKEGGVVFTCQIAGCIDQDVDREVKQRLRDLGECVIFSGSLSGKDKVQAFANANVFVLPTYYSMEGQPIALLEAMAAGNIVITTRHAGIPDVVDETNGYFVPSMSPDAIASVLQCISSDLCANIRRFSGPNSTYAAQRFTEARFYTGLLSVLSHVVRIKKGGFVRETCRK